MNPVSERIVASSLDESKYGIFFQLVSEKIVLIKKSKIERLHRLIWSLILTFAIIYYISVTKIYFRIAINDFLFYSIFSMAFIGLSLFYFYLYLRDGNKVLVSDSQNQILKINGRAVGFSMISCVLIDYSIGYMRASRITHRIFLKLKDGRKIYLGYATFKSLPGIVMALYDFLHVRIVDKSPKIPELGFINFSRDVDQIDG
jgi:hypothetical protein